MVEKNSFRVDIIWPNVYNRWIMILFLFSALVFQNGDTLLFMQDSTYFDTVIMHEYLIDARESVIVISKPK
jgi:hypothetical protein